MTEPKSKKRWTGEMKRRRLAVSEEDKKEEDDPSTDAAKCKNELEGTELTPTNGAWTVPEKSQEGSLSEAKEGAKGDAPNEGGNPADCEKVAGPETDPTERYKGIEGDAPVASENSQGGEGRRRRHHRVPKKPQIYTSNFMSEMHAKCGALRYRVHSPGCSCHSVYAAFERLRESHGDGDDAKSGSEWESPDGLLILPKTKWASHIYFCLNTEKLLYESNPLLVEEKLYREIFTKETNNHEVIKVSGAECLLGTNPNGFACISSPKLSTILLARDLALDKMERKRRGVGLHHDHAHAIWAISLQSLVALNRNRCGEDNREASHAVSREIVMQGFPLPHDVKFELGFHLQSLLALVEGVGYLFVLAYDDSEWRKLAFTIDLPGGKRQLGETPFEGTARETEEESSLVIEDDWLQGTKKSERARENMYFMLSPPEWFLKSAKEELSNVARPCDPFGRRPRSD